MFKGDCWRLLEKLPETVLSPETCRPTSQVLAPFTSALGMHAEPCRDLYIRVFRQCDRPRHELL